MRVVIATGIYPPDIGGPATHAVHLSDELRRRGHEVRILTVADDPGATGPDVASHRRGWPWPVRTAAAAAWLLRNRTGYDVVYASGLDLAAVVAGRLAGRPVVLKVVGDAAWERGKRRGMTTLSFDEFQHAGGGPAALRAMRAVRRWTARGATAVITPSEALRDTVDRWVGSRHAVTVVPNGALPNHYERPAGGATTPDGLQLLYVGRLVDHKRVDVLVEAVAATPGVELDIVGDGPERGRLEALVGGGAGEATRVRFAGSLSHDETMKRLARADLLVNASSYEGLPHVVVEALVSGVPVACTPSGGVVEVVKDGENGVLVPEAAPAAFAAVFARLRDDAGLRGRLADGARRSGEHWRFDRCADRIEAVLVTAVEGQPPRSGHAGRSQRSGHAGRSQRSGHAGRSQRSGHAGRPQAVFLGRAIPWPPSAELRRKYALHTGLLRQLTITTGKPGLRWISGVRVLAFPQLRPPLLGGAAFYSLAPFVAVARAAGRRHCAIVCQSPYEALGVIALARALPRRLRPRVQIELHGDWRTAPRLYGSPARAVLGPLCDRASAWAVRRADRVRAVSQSLEDQAREAGYDGPLDRHFTFSDFSAFLGSDRAPYTGPPRAVFIGVLERYKAIDLLFDAWPGVVERVPAAELVVVGSGTLGPALHSRVDDGVPHVSFREPMAQAELAALLDASTCLVLPSRSEGLPRVVMEAMARGRAVVASDVGGIRELVEDGVTGRLVPAEDVVALVDALSEVLGDPVLATSMGDEARRRAEARDPVAEYEEGIRRLAAWIAGG